MNVSIRHYKIFSTVAELVSFTAAAQKLHITPSALSQSMQELEKQLGFSLFDRTPRGVHLTAFGRSLLPYAERVLAEHESALLAAQRIRTGNREVVRIAGTSLSCCTFLPPALAACMRAYPEFDVELIDVQPTHLQSIISSGEAEIGVSSERPTDKALETTVLFGAPLHYICAANHAYARRRHVRWRDIESERLIFVDHQSADMIMRDLGPGYAIRATTQAQHLTTALALAAQNLGSLVNGTYVKPLLKSYPLKMIPLLEPLVVRNIVAYHRTHVPLSSAASLLLTKLQQVLREGSGHMPAATGTASSCSQALPSI